MLAELAVANAAFAVIKETVANGGDIMAAGQHLFSFFDNKAAIAKKANASGSDSEVFFALETIKQNEKALQELMVYSGRAGLWDCPVEYPDDGADYLWDEACLEWRAEGNTPLHADE